MLRVRNPHLPTKKTSFKFYLQQCGFADICYHLPICWGCGTPCTPFGYAPVYFIIHKSLS